MVPAIAATMSTASKTTASFSDAKNSKIELRCHAGCSVEFEVAMRDRHIPRGKCLLQGGTRCPQHVGNKSADSAKLFMPAAPSKQACAFGDWSSHRLRRSRSTTAKRCRMEGVAKGDPRAVRNFLL